MNKPGSPKRSIVAGGVLVDKGPALPGNLKG